MNIAEPKYGCGPADWLPFARVTAGALIFLIPDNFVPFYFRHSNVTERVSRKLALYAK
jgi:hypothetical protein